VSDVFYRNLADTLDRLPGRFPRTPSGAEIPLLRRLFTAEQARLGAVMGRNYEEASAIAARVASPLSDVGPQLDGMERNGLVLARDSAGRRSYRLAQFLDGIVELNLDRYGAELARLFEAYMNDGGARLLMGSPAYARVLPGEGSVRSEWVLPYDDVRAVLEQTPYIVLSDCFCRTERALVGAPCRFPLHVCLNLHAVEPSAEEGEVVSTEQALAILDQSEEAGLVHTVTNVQGGWDWLCNCCSCCCEWLRGYTEWQIETAVVRTYRVSFDEAACSSCGVCEKRCQVGAISVAGGLAHVCASTCIGCGLCVTTCPEGALQLERLPEPHVTLPPRDREAWEQERLDQRGPTG
jgi:Na+-translocating ferredoxin:NAD+ oxidoreductase subunit B